jgi:hypothetical protein
VLEIKLAAAIQAGQFQAHRACLQIRRDVPRRDKEPLSKGFTRLGISCGKCLIPLLRLSKQYNILVVLGFGTHAFPSLRQFLRVHSSGANCDSPHYRPLFTFGTINTEPRNVRISCQDREASGVALDPLRQWSESAHVACAKYQSLLQVHRLSHFVVEVTPALSLVKILNSSRGLP